MRKLLCCLLFSALAMGAAELTGKWSGSFDITTPNGETKADTAYMDLKEKVGDVTGTAGPGVEKQWSLRKGKLDGQKLTFEVPTDDGGLLVFDRQPPPEAICAIEPLPAAASASALADPEMVMLASV